MRLNVTFLTSWLLVLIICLLAGCKKTETVPDPDMASRVSGRYAVTTITITGNSQPITVVNGTVIMVRNGVALDTVDLTLSYATASTSGSSTFSETKTITLQQSGNAIDLYSGTTKVGSWTTALLTVTNYPFNNTTVSFTAAKQ
ncbi:hypothetical protein EXU85_33115 [Spirosoma sp. KCTC 42546]|uniref:hypothetical protein n=1 Tax=Spirosoma sp. KCTC 42546 TaxID=2520506 RepID=UPI00115B7DA1|nr:hypothetical protein [Spirosoma sp. KCTC 42546]QDK83185.1 hypothetical protein EXU85_33115 [Spirosoma sp. KCTC 42546]